MAGKICQEKADQNELHPHDTVDPRWKKPPVKLYCFQQKADELESDLRVLGEEDNRKMIEVGDDNFVNLFCRPPLSKIVIARRGKSSSNPTPAVTSKVSSIQKRSGPNNLMTSPFKG